MASMRRQVAYIQRHGATGETPISSFKRVNKWQQIQGDCENTQDPDHRRAARIHANGLLAR